MVLIFQVAAVTPAHHLQAQALLAVFSQSIRHVELAGYSTALGKAHQEAVHPDVEGGVDALENEYGAPLEARNGRSLGTHPSCAIEQQQKYSPI